MAGSIRKNQKMQMMSTGNNFEVLQVSQLTPKPVEVKELSSGMVGIVSGSIKTVSETRVGDTVTDPNNPSSEPPSGFQEAKQMVFGGIFPIDASEYQNQGQLGKASVERCFIDNRNGIFSGIGTWLSRWFPRPLAYGYHPRASGKRIWS